MVEYRFVEWRDETGAVIGTTPAISINVTGVKTLTAYFEEAPVVSHVLDILSAIGGTTDPPTGAYEYVEGTLVSVSAIPSENYNFSKWTLDGIEYTSNPINVLMDSDHTLIPSFTEEEPTPPEKYKLTISSTTGGTTNPAPGIYEVESGLLIQVTAIPNTGYQFSHFELDGVVKPENPIGLTMNKDYVLLAVFSEEAPAPSTKALWLIGIPVAVVTVFGLSQLGGE